MPVNQKAVVRQEECAACGCCTKVCSKGAVTIYKGIYALINRELCVGCGRCVKECPASIIEIKKEIKNKTEIERR